MSNSTQMRAQVDKLLTNVSNGYLPTGFVSELILPLISVDQYTGKLGGYGTTHLKVEAAITGGRGEFRRVDPIETNSQLYSIDSYGLETLVTKRDYANFDLPFNAERDRTLGLSSLLYVGKELGLAGALTNPAVMTQNMTLTGTNQWNDYTNSNPIGNVNTAYNTIYANTGVVPNFMVLNLNVARILKYHPQLVSSLGYNYARPGGLTAEEIAKAFDIEKIYVASAVYDSSPEGQPSNLLPIWGKDCVLGTSPGNSLPWQKSLGYRLQKSGSAPRTVYKYLVNNPAETTALQCVDEYSFFLSDIKSGYLIQDAIA